VKGPGFTVALIGCDGAGKTTVARKLEQETDLPLRYVYMGVSVDSSNYALPTTRLMHMVKRRRGAPPDTAGPRELPVGPPPKVSLPKRLKRSVRSSVRLTNRLAEEWYRQMIASAAKRKGSIVVFDRHFIADYYAADVKGEHHRTWSRRLHGWLLTKTYPAPDLVVFLDAPAEVLYARKGEGTIASLTRRREDYLRLGKELEDFVIVAATQPLPTVVEQVESAIRKYGATR
jgi:thymidylate kinase